MNINIDFDKINKIYGIETLNNIKENINVKNIVLLFLSLKISFIFLPTLLIQ